MTSHDLDDECALVRSSGTGQLIDRIQDAVQGGIRADRHIRAHHVVINRTNQADNDQGRVGISELLRDSALRNEFGQVLGPFAAELVRTRQRAVTSDDNQVVDAVLQQVRGCAVTPLVRAEFGAASRADDRATFCKDRGHVRPLQLLDGIAPVARPLPALKDRIGLRLPRQGRAHHCADGRVHALGIAARGQDTDTNCAHISASFH